MIASKIPIVSVLMTVYNREKYIADAIESVINSSYQNWELIIVDDQSTDKSVEIARTYALKDDRIRIYVNEVNLGQFENRNKAASYAKGKYLKYLDSDDFLYPHGLMVMVNAMEQFPEAGIGFHDHRYNGQKKLPYLLSSYQAYYHHFFTGGLLIQGPSAGIFNRDHFFKIGGFETNYGVASDGAFNLNAAMDSPVVIFNRDLFWWRTHDGQEFNLLNDKYEELNNELNSYFLTHPNCPLDNKTASVAFFNLKNILARKVITHVANLEFHLGFSKYRKFNLTISQIFLCFIPSKYRRLIQKQKIS